MGHRRNSDNNTNKQDEFYTPSELANFMVRHASDVKSGIVADFAAGDGRLLTVARARWPACLIVATDISVESVAHLRSMGPDWRIGQCDFMNEERRGQCDPLRDLSGKVALALLNPPFSCRGNTLWPAQLGGEVVRCGLALAFVITAIPYILPGGEIVAVIPSGCLNTQKDRAAWELITRYCETEILANNHCETFRGCSPKTCIVRFRLRPIPTPRKLRLVAACTEPVEGLRTQVTLFRGKISMNTVPELAAAGRTVPLIHSTDIKTGELAKGCRSVKLRRDVNHYVSGPCVLIPRVCNVRKPKLALYKSRKLVALSDCVIAVSCRSVRDAISVHTQLLEHWEEVVACYTGTCAPYITLERLEGLLKGLGFRVVGKLDEPQPNTTASQQFGPAQLIRSA